MLRAALLAASCASAAAAGGVVVTSYSELGGAPYSIGFDERSLLVGGRP
jgi:hypothetical protein